MPKRPKISKKLQDDFFLSECTMFKGLIKHATLISNRVGPHIATPSSGVATWLFMRACVTSKSIERLFEPQQTDFGDVRYLDHASIASLSRALIENVAVMLYVGDTSIGEDESACRRQIIDLHDYVTRSAFLTYINHQTGPRSDPRMLASLSQRVVENSFFKTLPLARQKRLLNGDDMFIDGRHAALLKFGWGQEMTRGVYKYLSNQAHSLSMSFHRTEVNRLYEQDSTAAKVAAGFVTEFARKALGAGCLHMITLFPYVEAVFDPAIFAALKSEYTPTS